jgi:hypothetical protein
MLSFKQRTNELDHFEKEVRDAKLVKDVTKGIKMFKNLAGKGKFKLQ